MSDDSYKFHYLVAFDVNEAKIDPQAIYNYVTQNRHFLTWAHIFPGIYVIETNLYLKSVQDMLVPIMNGTNFLVISVSPGVAGGWLQQRFWDWFQTRARANDQLLLPNLPLPPDHR